MSRRRADRRREVVDQNVATQGNGGGGVGWQIIKKVEAVWSGKIGRRKQLGGIIIKNQIGFQRIADAVEVRTNTYDAVIGIVCVGLAVDRRHAIGEFRDAVNAHTNVISGNDNIGS